jgi:hypothetical protein
MSLEKPWEEPYDELLGKIAMKWEGKIYKPSPKSTKNMFIYPTFVGTKNGMKFEIDVSEFPDRKMNMLEAEDNVEYLRISIIVPNQYAVRITHEDFAFKVRKALRLTKEFQTGSMAFDKKYWLKLNSTADEKLLTNRIFQDKVFQLEPLALLEITRQGILWSQEITRKSQLSITSLEKHLNNVFAIAAIISDRKPEIKPVPVPRPVAVKKPVPAKKPAAKRKPVAKKKPTTVKKKTTAKKAAPVKKKVVAKTTAPKKVRCAGKTADGKRCKRLVAKPSKYCHLHKKR